MDAIFAYYRSGFNWCFLYSFCRKEMGQEVERLEGFRRILHEFYNIRMTDLKILLYDKGKVHYLQEKEVTENDFLCGR